MAPARRRCSTCTRRAAPGCAPRRWARARRRRWPAGRSAMVVSAGLPWNSSCLKTWSPVRVSTASGAAVTSIAEVTMGADTMTNGTCTMSVLPMVSRHGHGLESHEPRLDDVRPAADLVDAVGAQAVGLRLGDDLPVAQDLDLGAGQGPAAGGVRDGAEHVGGGVGVGPDGGRGRGAVTELLRRRVGRDGSDDQGQRATGAAEGGFEHLEHPRVQSVRGGGRAWSVARARRTRTRTGDVTTADLGEYGGWGAGILVEAGTETRRRGHG